MPEVTAERDGYCGLITAERDGYLGLITAERDGYCGVGGVGNVPA